MDKIAFIGAGSTIFAKNVLGDCMLTPLTSARSPCSLRP
jgi:alpha-galactosidase/6-phospho-beta-glucosidase family protein